MTAFGTPMTVIECRKRLLELAQQRLTEFEILRRAGTIAADEVRIAEEQVLLRRIELLGEQNVAGKS